MPRCLLGLLGMGSFFLIAQPSEAQLAKPTLTPAQVRQAVQPNAAAAAPKARDVFVHEADPKKAKPGSISAASALKAAVPAAAGKPAQPAAGGAQVPSINPTSENGLKYRQITPPKEIDGFSPHFGENLTPTVPVEYPLSPIWLRIRPLVGDSLTVNGVDQLSEANLRRLIASNDRPSFKLNSPPAADPLPALDPAQGLTPDQINPVDLAPKKGEPKASPVKGQDPSGQVPKKQDPAGAKKPSASPKSAAPPEPKTPAKKVPNSGGSKALPSTPENGQKPVGSAPAAESPADATSLDAPPKSN